jgi:hypothetical protein
MSIAKFALYLASQDAVRTGSRSDGKSEVGWPKIIFLVKCCSLPIYALGNRELVAAIDKTSFGELLKVDSSNTKPENSRHTL